MSMVRGFEGGEQVLGEPDRRTRRPKGTREEAIRERAVSLFLGRLEGKPARFLAAKYGITPRHVAAEVATLPAPVRARLERLWRDGDPGVRLLAMT